MRVEGETVTVARAAGAKMLAFLSLPSRIGKARRRGLSPGLPARIDRYDFAAAVLFCGLVILIALTVSQYAISNDEEVQQRYGEMIVAYYASGFVDQALFHFRDLYLYGGLFDVVAVGFEKIIPLDAYVVRHLLCALTGVAGIAAAWAAARTIGGPRAGLLAAAALAVCGTWYGAMFAHTKDIPFAAAMMGALYVLLLLARELPRPRWRLVLLFGVLCGCALGIRVLGLFLIGYAGLAVLAYAPIGRGYTASEALAFVSRSALALAPAFVVAYAIMIAAWPWAGLAPLNPLRAITAFDNLNAPINTILAGHIYRMADVPRWYVPAYVAIKLTLPLLVGSGLALALVMIRPQVTPSAGKSWRSEVILTSIAAFLPLVCAVVAHTPADTGMRHFLFTVPPIAVLAGLGFDGVFRRMEALNRLAAAAGLAIVLPGLCWNAATLYRLHPEEYLFFNALVGGLEGASRRFATDYWVNIMPEAVDDLERFLDRDERASRKPFLHRYLVAVCGERLPFEKKADARLKWTRDWDHADFFIAPTHMNCDRALDGQVVATVERLGVLIGVVKDRRALVSSHLAHK